MRALFLLLLLTAAGCVAEAASDPPQCAKDSDCVVTNQSYDCCGCCHCALPYAMSVTEQMHAQHRCAIVDCTAPKCDAVRCPACLDTSKMKAQCTQGRCEIVK
jgi:hypothetical protein